MRKFLLTLFLSLLCPFVLLAQTELQRGDFGLVGEWSLLQSCQSISAPNLAKISSAGSGQTWDALFLAAELEDTLRFKDATAFPMAHERTNLVWDTDDGLTDTRFFQGLSTSIKQALMPEGNFGIQGLVDYLVFPMILGQSFRDSIQSEIRGLMQDFGIPENPLFDSARVVFQVNHSSLTDGEGSLKWPMRPQGLICLRRKLEVKGSTRFELRNKLTGVYGPVPGGFDPGGIQFNHTWIQFFAQNFPSPILEYKMNSQNQVEAVSWVMNSSRNVANSLPELGASSLKVWPNPASDFIALQASGKLRLYAVDGICVAEVHDYQEGARFSLAQFRPGIYMILLENERGFYQTKFVKM